MEQDSMGVAMMFGSERGHELWAPLGRQKAGNCGGLARRLARCGLVLSTALVLNACGGAQDPLPGPKHILIISLDTLRADHLGAYGDNRKLTPTMDYLASNGVVFEAAMTPAPTTLAAHTSIFTGSYPQTHGVVRNGFVVHPDNETLAESLLAKEFHTAAFLGSFALDSRFGLDQGFQVFNEDFDSLVTPGRDQNQRSAGAVTDAVLTHLDQLTSIPERTFLFAHYFDAHLPYEPPLELAARFGADPKLVVDQNYVESVVQAKHRDWIGLTPKDPGFGLGGSIVQGLWGPHFEKAKHQSIPEDRAAVKLYAAEVAAIDEALARLVEGLESRGMLGDTLIVLTGDHGESFWEHADYWNHGLWVYESTVHVPMVMYWPNGPWEKGLRVREPVSTVDLVPTLLDLLDLKPGARVDGETWMRALQGMPMDRGPIFSVATQPYAPTVERVDLTWANARKPHAIRLGPWKLVQSDYNDREELFHLVSDPHEQKNLLDGGKNALASIQGGPEALQQLRKLLSEFKAGARPLPSAFDASQGRETAERLGAMGY